MSKGFPYLAPELQLLFKSKDNRTKDDRDATEVIPALNDEQRRRLRALLPGDHPGGRCSQRDVVPTLPACGARAINYAVQSVDDRIFAARDGATAMTSLLIPALALPHAGHDNVI